MFELSIQQLAHDNGLHQHLFMNVPPMEKAPLFNTNETLVAMLKNNVDKFNEAVQQRTKEFEAQNSGKEHWAPIRPFTHAWRSRCGSTQL